MTPRTEQELQEIAQRILTAKQLRVLNYWLDGHSYRQIARALDVSEATVRGHFEAALKRLKPHLRKDAA